MQRLLECTTTHMSIEKRSLTMLKDEAASCLKTARIPVSKVMHVYRKFNINPLDVRQLEKLMLYLINTERSDSKYSPETKGLAKSLLWHDQASEVARAYSWDMAMRNYFAHHNPEGITVAQRISRVKISWLLVGENIGVSHDVAAVHYGFMDEPSHQQNHRGNILNRHFTHIGIGICRPSDGILFISQIFLKLK